MRQQMCVVTHSIFRVYLQLDRRKRPSIDQDFLIRIKKSQVHQGYFALTQFGQDVDFRVFCSSVV